MSTIAEQISATRQEETKRLAYITKRLQAKVRPALEHGDGKPPKIDKNVPIPVELRGHTSSGNNSHFYPFEKMKVGHSFWIGGGGECTRGAVSKFAKKSGWKFITRTQTKDGRKNADVGANRRGMRVWRVA